LSGRGLCDELITRPEESYRLWCVVVCDLETSRMGAPYINDISRLRVNSRALLVIMQWKSPVFNIYFFTESVHTACSTHILTPSHVSGRAATLLWRSLTCLSHNICMKWDVRVSPTVGVLLHPQVRHLFWLPLSTLWMDWEGHVPALAPREHENISRAIEY
jgi:hypothetical protein